MPTVFTDGPFRFFFYSSDGEEPIHVHVERDSKTAKFWLKPIRLQQSLGFSQKELKHIVQTIEMSLTQIEEKWNEFFSS